MQVLDVSSQKEFSERQSDRYEEKHTPQSVSISEGKSSPRVWSHQFLQGWEISQATVSRNKTGADCGSDRELLIAKFRLKLKKKGKTTGPFGYDLNQIPYDYTVEVRNRFKGLDLIDRVPDELWTEVRDTVQETGSKTIPMEKKCKKTKWLSEEALQIAVKRREAKSK